MRGPPVIPWLLLVALGERATQVHLAAVRKHDVAWACAVGAIPGGEGVDDDLGSDGQRIAIPATAQQQAGSTALDLPFLETAIGLFDVDVEPRMRVDPCELRDRTLDVYDFRCVELGGEGVMSVSR